MNWKRLSALLAAGVVLATGAALLMPPFAEYPPETLHPDMGWEHPLPLWARLLGVALTFLGSMALVGIHRLITQDATRMNSDMQKKEIE
jgi:hypothetical protein